MEWTLKIANDDDVDILIWASRRYMAIHLDIYDNTLYRQTDAYIDIGRIGELIDILQQAKRHLQDDINEELTP